MAEKGNEFLKRLLAIFNVEAQEHIGILFAGIDELEHAADEEKRAALVEKIFREAHSLKGAARSVKLTRIETECQSLENTFAAMKRKEIALTPAFFDGLHQTVKHLHAMLFPEASDLPPGAPPAEEPAALQEAAPQAQAIAPKAETAVTSAVSRHSLPDDKPASSAATVRITAAKLDAVLLQTEEMLAAKLRAQQRRQELREINELAVLWEKGWANLRERYPGFYGAATMHPQGTEFLEHNTVTIKNLRYRLELLAKSADRDQQLLGKMVDNLLGSMKEALMLPFSTLTESFPRMVREFSREAGKEIDLDIRGGEIEADRRILEEIKDPLLHLLRNCVDHGIEKPQQRTAGQKPPRGTIRIAFAPRSGNRVEIRIADDGAGIDVDKVKATAERLGVLTAEQINKLDRQQALQLIYQSGISTSPIITEISGRGLGLAIVQEKVDRLSGSISLETQPHAGTAFSIVLPLMFATYRGIVVRVGEQRFVVPATGMERTLRVTDAEIRTAENRETINVNGATLSLARLGDVLALPRSSSVTSASSFRQVVVLLAGGKRIAFVVDEVLYEQEVLVKSLGKQLSRVRNIAGATILGSGKVVPVLNVADLIKSAPRISVSGARAASAADERKPQDKSVLVVEDSITARSLLKGILESAGYRVATAVDGIDGLTRLRSGEFDMVVSDVDMPRMNGFDLTAKIRGDRKLAELPVVLVTALASREDRERGIDVGANAYIVKSNFEQSNLLEVVQRLI